MITDEQLVSYASGLLTGDERARFEVQLAQDPDALRRLVEQERMDAALCFVVGDRERETLRQSILDVAAWPTQGQFAEGVVTDTTPEPIADEAGPTVRPPWREWVRAHGRLLTCAGAAILVLLCLIVWLTHQRKPERTQPPRPVPGMTQPAANDK